MQNNKIHSPAGILNFIILFFEQVYDSEQFFLFFIAAGDWWRGHFLFSCHIIFLSLLLFLAAPRHMEFLGHGSDLSHNCSLCCGNTGSLTHCARPGSNLHPGSAETLPILLCHSRNFLSLFLINDFIKLEFPSWKWIRLGTMRFQVWFLAWCSGLRILCCRELLCRSQTQLGSGVAVAVA